jgi:hypothetical protein
MLNKSMTELSNCLCSIYMPVNMTCIVAYCDLTIFFHYHILAIEFLCINISIRLE